MHPPPAFNLTELDRQLLVMRDEDYVEHTWEDLENIIGETYLLPRLPLNISSSLLSLAPSFSFSSFHISPHHLPVASMTPTTNPQFSPQ